MSLQVALPARRSVDQQLAAGIFQHPLAATWTWTRSSSAQTSARGRKPKQLLSGHDAGTHAGPQMVKPGGSLVSRQRAPHRSLVAKKHLKAVAQGARHGERLDLLLLETRS